MKHALVASILLTTLPAPLAAQYRTAKIPAVGISISIPSKLKGLPLRLDSSDPYLRARYRTSDRKDLVKTKSGKRVNWQVDVYEFGAKPKGPTTPGRGGEKEKEEPKTEKEKKLQELLEKLRARSTVRGAAESFADWVERFRDAKIVTKAKPMKKKGKKLPYKKWEIVTAPPRIRSPFGTSYPQYLAAAVYELDQREVAVVVSAPLEEGDRPKGQLASYCKYILASGRLLKDGEGEIKDNRSRDRYANTPGRKKALEAAKANIASLRNWTYFTSPNYIVLFSWKTPTERVKSENFARRLTKGLEKMRKLYMKYYEPRQGMKLPYSVFRVCATYEQFQKYGNSPRGVVGWFSPRSKELVVFQGGDARMRKKGYIETVTYHEGWHQYCNAFFGGATVHRWFDEGHGDFFGAHKPVAGGFAYVGSGMRYKWVKLMVKKGDYVKFKDIVKWPRSRFYGSPRTSYYYAQAYGMIDFLRRGPAMGKRKFDPKWSEILPTYRRVMLEKRNNKLAVEAAFQDVDFVKLEESWKAWVNSSRFKKPK